MSDEIADRHRGALHPPGQGDPGEERAEVTAKTITDAMILVLLEDGRQERREDLCAVCVAALRYPTTVRTLEAAMQRFAARKACADEINLRARHVPRYARLLKMYAATVLARR